MTVSAHDTPELELAPFDIRMPELPTGMKEIVANLDVRLNWDYRVDRTDLRGLYERSKVSMWNAQTDIDWSIDVDPESDNMPDEMIPIFGTRLWDRLDKKRELPKLRRLLHAYALSNFLHGEQGALVAAAQLVTSVPDTDAKFYASTQVMDEARHVEAYDKYLREKLETTFPISPYLDEMLVEILQEPRWDLKYLGMQIMVEGLALAAFGMVLETSNEPLIRSIVTKIMQDEARHVAFGVMSLKGYYDDMSPSELSDREDFLIRSSKLMHDRFLYQDVWEHMGMPVEECLEAVRHSQTQKMFRGLLFSKIVPNIKRLGLLTERVRATFDELDVLHFESWEATA
jgi:hypothetical protein